MSTQPFGDETVTMAAADRAAPAPPASGSPMTPSQEAQYALDWNLGPDHLEGDARADYDRLVRLHEYHAQHPQPVAAPPPPGPQPGGQDGSIDPDELARFRAHQARQAAIAEAMRGNGSGSAFVRWLTRKPLPIKMTTSRVVCGLLWALWTVVCLIYMVDGGGASAAFTGFILTVLCGFYDFRIWTKRATRLAYFIIF